MMFRGQCLTCAPPAWEYPVRGCIYATCGCKLGPHEHGELITFWSWDGLDLREMSGTYCVWHALAHKVSGLHIDTWVYGEDDGA